MASKIQGLLFVLIISVTVMTQDPGRITPRPPPRTTPSPRLPPGQPRPTNGPPSDRGPPGICIGPDTNSFEEPQATECPERNYPTVKIQRYLRKNQKLRYEVIKKRRRMRIYIKRTGFCRLQSGPPSIGTPGQPGICPYRDLYYRFPECILYEGLVWYVLKPWSYKECPYVSCVYQSCQKPVSMPPGKCVHSKHRTIAFFVIRRSALQFRKLSIKLPQRCSCVSSGCGQK